MPQRTSLNLTPWQKHVREWSSCDRCLLAGCRRTVCLARGSIPADVLFIGEAPGESEDVIGRPFVGPAGKLLDRIIDEAWRSMDMPDGRGGRFIATYCLTNLVGCIPRDADGDKAGEPDIAEIHACQPRLAEMVAMVRPRLIVLVGTLAQKHVRWDRGKLGLGDTKLVDVHHPAYILRSNVAQQGLLIQKTVVVLSNALEELCQD